MSTSVPCYKRHRFPPAIVAHAVWLYLRFSLNLRAIEELLLERGIEVSHETLRRWVMKFGPVIARNLRRRQAHSTVRNAFVPPPRRRHSALTARYHRLEALDL